MSNWSLEARIGLITLLVQISIPVFALALRVAYKKWFVRQPCKPNPTISIVRKAEIFLGDNQALLPLYQEPRRTIQSHPQRPTIVARTWTFSTFVLVE